MSFHRVPANHHVTSAARKRYMLFHETEPQTVDVGTGWCPGELVLLGHVLNQSYFVKKKVRSAKRGPYIHKTGDAVKLWRRAQPGERPDRVYSRWPKEMVVIGDFIDCEFVPVGEDDDAASCLLKNEQGADKMRVAIVTPKCVAFVSGRGVEYVVRGGSFRVEDWMYD